VPCLLGEILLDSLLCFVWDRIIHIEDRLNRDICATDMLIRGNIWITHRGNSYPCHDTKCFVEIMTDIIEIPVMVERSVVDDTLSGGQRLDGHDASKITIFEGQLTYHVPDRTGHKGPGLIDATLRSYQVFVMICCGCLVRTQSS